MKIMIFKKILHACIGVVSVFVLASNTANAQLNWTGGGANGDWTNQANWDLVPPAEWISPGTLRFQGNLNTSTLNNFPAGQQYDFRFDANASAFTLAGARVELVGSFDITRSIEVTGTATDPNTLITHTISLETTLSGSSQVITQNNRNIEVNGPLSGSGALQKLGQGVLTLAGNNTSGVSSYTGAITVTNGILRVTNSNALGAGTAGTSVAGGATLQLENNVSIGSESLSLNGSGVGNGGALQSVSGSNSYTGPITLAGAARINADSGSLTVGSISGANALTLGGSGTINANGIISTDSLTKDGNGVLNLSNANTYAGTTTISAGVVNMQNANAFGTTANGTTVASGAAIQLQGGITTAAEGLTLNGTGISGGGALRSISGNNVYTGAITLSSNARINSDAGTLLIDVTSGNSITSSGQSITFGGAGNITVNDGLSLGAGGITKDGTGTLVLAGSNNYDGNTVVEAGKLFIEGSLNSAGALIVENGASLGGNGTISGDIQIDALGKLMGKGTINGNVSIAGTHSPGNSPGLQTINGNLTYTSGSSLDWELIDNTAASADRGIKYDGINVNGDLTFAGATTMNLIFNDTGSQVNWNDTFWDFDQEWLVYDVSGTTTGFNLLGIGAANWLDGSNNLFNAVRSNAFFSLRQDGSDIILQYSAVPEPGSIALMSVVGLFGGGRLVRRFVRRRKDEQAN